MGKAKHPRKFKAGQTYGQNFITKVTPWQVWFKCPHCPTEGRISHEKANRLMDERTRFVCCNCGKNDRNNAEWQQRARGAKLETAEILDRHFVSDANGKQRLELTIRCQNDECGAVFAGKIMSFRRLEKIKRRLLCPECVAKYRNERAAEIDKKRAEPRTFGKLPDVLIRKLESMHPAMRAAVDEIVKNHLMACLENETEIVGLERIYAEAIEVAALDAREPQGERYSSHEPARHYGQYTSPLADAA